MQTVKQAHVPHNTGSGAETSHGHVIRIHATTTVVRGKRVAAAIYEP